MIRLNQTEIISETAHFAEHSGYYYALLPQNIK